MFTISVKNCKKKIAAGEIRKRQALDEQKNIAHLIWPNFSCSNFFLQFLRPYSALLSVYFCLFWHFSEHQQTNSERKNVRRKTSRIEMADENKQLESTDDNSKWKLYMINIFWLCELYKQRAFFYEHIKTNYVAVMRRIFLNFEKVFSFLGWCE